MNAIHLTRLYGPARHQFPETTDVLGNQGFRVADIEQADGSNDAFLVGNWAKPFVDYPNRPMVPYEGFHAVMRSFRANRDLLAGYPTPGPNAHRGKPAILVGNGPSRLKHDAILKTIDTDAAVCIGVNGAIKAMPRGSYFFCIEGRVVPEWLGDRPPSDFIAVLPSDMLIGDIRRKWMNACIYNLKRHLWKEDEFTARWPHFMVLDSCKHAMMSAFHLAYQWGCDPIIFAGCDYSFPNPNMVHANSTGVGDETTSDRVDLVDINGEPVVTDAPYWVFARQMAAATLYVCESGRTVINATEGGIFTTEHPNFSHRPLHAVLEELKCLRRE